MSNSTKRMFCFVFMVVLFPILIRCSPPTADVTDGGQDGKIDALENDAVAINSAPVSNSIEGEWFYCLDKTCNILDYYGIRFTKEGQVTNLYAGSKTHRNGEDYCHLTYPDFVGTYVWTKREVLADMPSSTTTERFGFLVQENLATMNPGDDPDYLRRVTTGSKGPCSARLPWVCPEFPLDIGSLLGGQICTGAFTCDNGQFMLNCEVHTNETAHTCSCYEKITGSESRVAKTFKLHNACIGQTLDTFLSMANKGCDWNLWVPPMFE